MKFFIIVCLYFVTSLLFSLKNVNCNVLNDCNYFIRDDTVLPTDTCITYSDGAFMLVCDGNNVVKGESYSNNDCNGTPDYIVSASSIGVTEYQCGTSNCGITMITSNQGNCLHNGTDYERLSLINGYCYDKDGSSFQFNCINSNTIQYNTYVNNLCEGEASFSGIGSSGCDNETGEYIEIECPYNSYSSYTTTNDIYTSFIFDDINITTTSVSNGNTNDNENSDTNGSDSGNDIRNTNDCNYFVRDGNIYPTDTCIPSNSNTQIYACNGTDLLVETYYSNQDCNGIPDTIIPASEIDDNITEYKCNGLHCGIEVKEYNYDNCYQSGTDFTIGAVISNYCYDINNNSSVQYNCINDNIFEMNYYNNNALCNGIPTISDTVGNGCNDISGVSKLYEIKCSYNNDDDDVIIDDYHTTIFADILNENTNNNGDISSSTIHNVIHSISTIFSISVIFYYFILNY